MIYTELLTSLPQSSAEDRKVWAAQIIKTRSDIKELSKLALHEDTIANRFLWLLSEIGELDPDYLYQYLPYLLQFRNQLNHLTTEASFANFWLISGVPEENEAQAIDLLFTWIQSDKCNVTAKSRSALVLFKLTLKYPDLKNELKLSLQDQTSKHTPDFDKKIQKILTQLNV